MPAASSARGSYAASGGLHGVGASVVNALSRAARRRGRPRRQDLGDVVPPRRAGRLRRRRPGDPTPDAPFTPVRDGQRTARGRQGRQGRHRHAHPLLGRPRRSSPRAPTFQTDELLGRARQTAFLVPGLGIDIDDDRGEQPVDDDLQLRRAASPSSSTSSRPTRRSPTPGASRATGTFTETVPVLQATGRHGRRPSCTRECEVDIALRWGTGYDTVFNSFVNIIATPKGGTHQPGFEQGMLKFLRAAGRAERAPARRSATTSSRRTTSSPG